MSCLQPAYLWYLTIFFKKEKNKHCFFHEVWQLSVGLTLKQLITDVLPTVAAGPWIPAYSVDSALLALLAPTLATNFLYSYECSKGTRFILCFLW